MYALIYNICSIFCVVCRQKVATTDIRRQEDKCYSSWSGQSVKLKEQLNACSSDLIEVNYKRSGM